MQIYFFFLGILWSGEKRALFENLASAQDFAIFSHQNNLQQIFVRQIFLLICLWYIILYIQLLFGLRVNISGKNSNNPWMLLPAAQRPTIGHLEGTVGSRRARRCSRLRLVRPWLFGRGRTLREDDGCSSFESNEVSGFMRLSSGFHNK